MICRMTRKEQFEFVKGLIANVQEELIEKIDRVPENWNGVELRHWIADRFKEVTCKAKKPRHYKNDVITRNL